MSGTAPSVREVNRPVPSRVCARYNQVVARGWESKSVEGQIASFESERRVLSKQQPTREQIERERKREALLLSRKRVLHDLEQARIPQRRKMLEASLAHLDAKLAELD